MSFKVDFSCVPQAKIRGRADVVEHQLRALEELQAIYGGEFRVSHVGTPYLVTEQLRIGIWWIRGENLELNNEQEVRAWLNNRATTSLIG